MDLQKDFRFSGLSHDLFLNGSQSFYEKILPENYWLQYFFENPYPVQSPCKTIQQDKIDSFRRNNSAIRQKVYAERLFKTNKSLICGQDFQEHAVLPNFFLDYIGNENRNVVEYGLNIPYSQGVLEKFYHFNDIGLIRPNLDNNLLIYRPDHPEEKITLEWLPDKILHIQSLNLENSTKLLLRCEKTIYLIEIDENFDLKINIKFNYDKGYQGTAFNDINKSELAIVDQKSKLKFVNIETQAVFSSYSWKQLNLSSKPRIFNLDYLDESNLMLITDKQIKLIDTRCKDLPQDVSIEIADCDMLVGFTFNKNEECLPNTVYMSSKHSYFIYDIRTTGVDDFVSHNLRSPPCYVNYMREKEMKLVTLHSQSASEQVVFGIDNPYSLPYLMNTLEDTYESCKSKKNIPLIPDINRRLHYPVLGAQILNKNGDVSIYTTNILGELFCQNVAKQSSEGNEPIDRMYDWLMELHDANDDPPLNYVCLANASAPFNADCDIHEVDLYEGYEKCDVNSFLKDENFDYGQWKADAFLEIWGTDEETNINLLVDSQPTSTKVEEWIVNTKFDIDQELEKDQLLKND